MVSTLGGKKKTWPATQGLYTLHDGCVALNLRGGSGLFVEAVVDCWLTVRFSGVLKGNRSTPPTPRNPKEANKCAFWVGRMHAAGGTLKMILGFQNPPESR